MRKLLLGLVLFSAFLLPSFVMAEEVTMPFNIAILGVESSGWQSCPQFTSENFKMISSITQERVNSLDLAESFSGWPNKFCKSQGYEKAAEGAACYFEQAKERWRLAGLTGYECREELSEKDITPLELSPAYGPNAQLTSFYSYQGIGSGSALTKIKCEGEGQVRYAFDIVKTGFNINAWEPVFWSACNTQDGGRAWADKLCQFKGFSRAAKGNACYHDGSSVREDGSFKTDCLTRYHLKESSSLRLEDYKGNAADTCGNAFTKVRCVKIEQKLTINVNGQGRVKITYGPATLRQSLDSNILSGSTFFAADEEVVLEAQPLDSSLAVSWPAGLCMEGSASNTCTIKMDSAEDIESRLMAGEELEKKVIVKFTCSVQPEICDGKDNDCDGQIDEGLGETTCGIGACQRTIQNCLNGQIQTCTPGSPSTEICGNNIDEDCNGADLVCSHQLTLTKIGTGTVTAIGLGCTENTCTGSYTAGTAVTLTASSTDSTITWTGCDSFAGTGAAVKLTGNLIKVMTGAAIKTSPNISLFSKLISWLTKTPITGKAVASSTCSVTMNQAKTVTVTFTPIISKAPAKTSQAVSSKTTPTPTKTTQAAAPSKTTSTQTTGPSKITSTPTPAKTTTTSEKAPAETIPTKTAAPSEAAPTLAPAKTTPSTAAAQTKTVAPSTAAPAKDTTAPTLSSLQPTGKLAAGTTKTILSLTTSEPATCKFSTTSGVAYDKMKSTLSTTGATQHKHNVGGLTKGKTYKLYIKCKDAAGNINAKDSLLTFSIAK